MLIQFDDFEIDCHLLALSRRGEEVPVEPLALRVLIYLIEHEDSIITKDQLIDEVWPGQFVSDSSLTRAVHQARKAVCDDASEQRIIKTFYGRGYRFVAPFQTVKPSTRWPSANRTANTQTNAPIKRRRTAIWIWAVALLVIAGAGIIVVLSSASLRKRPAVAVLGFQNLSEHEEVDWMATAFAEWFTTELTVSEGVRVIPRRRILRMRADLGDDPRHIVTPEIIAKVRHRLGAEIIVLGSYTVIDDQLRIDVNIEDARGNTVEASLTNNCLRSDVLSLVSTLGGQLRNTLRCAPLTQEQEQELREALPETNAGARWYADGIDLLSRSDALGARDVLLQAVAAEPGMALAHQALSRAWMELGYEAASEREAKTALDLSPGLPEGIRADIEAQYYEVSQKWEEAENVLSRLCRLHPEEIEYGLRLAHVQATAGHGKRAFSTIDGLRDTPEPLRSDPRIDYAEAEAAGLVADFERKSAAAGRAASRALQLGSRDLAARAMISQAWALRHLGKPVEAQHIIEKAHALYEQTGNRSGIAQAFLHEGISYFDQAKLELAIERYEAAIEVYRQIGNQLGMANVRGNIGVIRWQQGRFEDARSELEECVRLFESVGHRKNAAGAMGNIAWLSWEQGHLEVASRDFEEVLTRHEEMGDLDGMARTRSNLAVLRAAEGRFEEATQLHKLALAGYQEIGHKPGEAGALLNLTELLCLQGRLSDARTNCKRAEKIAHEIGNKSTVSNALAALAEVVRLEGDLEHASTIQKRALGIRNETGEKASAARSHLFLALLAIDENRLFQAESAAARVAPELEEAGLRDPAAEAWSIAAEARYRRHEASAAEALEKAIELSRDSHDIRVRIQVSRIKALIENNPQALIALEREARSAGAHILALEVGLTHARVLLLTRQSQQAQRRLEAIIAVAEQLHVDLVKIKAKALLSAAQEMNIEAAHEGEGFTGGSFT